ncbi:MAG: putative hydro-lyase [Bacillota bacterium]
MKDLEFSQPKKVRELFKKEVNTRPTAGLARGFAQANLIILPEDLAFEFMLFAYRNPKPCPLLDVLEVGNPEPVMSTPGADIRTDLPKYRIYKNGELKEEVTNIKDYWRDDLVSFLLGCSFTFEDALLKAEIPIRHIEENRNVPMYITNIETEEAGRFSGPLVVSMRPLPSRLISKAVQISGEYEEVHGAPVHIGNPEEIGIGNINKPDFGEAVTVKENEIPVFWACGVTPQAVIMQSKLPFVITHSPGHMFITDIKNENLSSY